jgi:predicted enzyme related to lactoylglutathione lyase
LTTLAQRGYTQAGYNLIEKRRITVSISGVGKVVIDVEDQDRARTFWVEKMGFDVARDASYGGERWLEVRSPDETVVLVLGRSSTGPGDRGAVDDRLPTSNVMFRCDDIAATYHELADRGVDFPQPPIELNFGWWCLFADTEGNRFALQPNGH